VVGSRGASRARGRGIIGVVEEIRERGVTEELKATVYRLHDQADQGGGEPSGIVVRTSVEPESIVPAVQQAVWSVDPNEPVARVQTGGGSGGLRSGSSRRGPILSKSLNR
jgi:hypothetical protein